MVDLLTIHGPVRDPYLSEFSERYDLDSGCSVESTLLLHLAVVLPADARLRNSMYYVCIMYVFMYMYVLCVYYVLMFDVCVMNV